MRRIFQKVFVKLNFAQKSGVGHGEIVAGFTEIEVKADMGLVGISRVGFYDKLKISDFDEGERFGKLPGLFLRDGVGGVSKQKWLVVVAKCVEILERENAFGFQGIGVEQNVFHLMTFRHRVKNIHFHKVEQFQFV